MHGKCTFPSHSGPHQGSSLLVSDNLLQRGSMYLHTRNIDVPSPTCKGPYCTGCSPGSPYPLSYLTMKVNSNLVMLHRNLALLSHDCVVFHWMDVPLFNWSFIYIHLGYFLFFVISKPRFNKYPCVFMFALPCEHICETDS